MANDSTNNKALAPVSKLPLPKRPRKPKAKGSEQHRLKMV